MTSSCFSCANLLEGSFQGIGVLGFQSDDVLVQEQAGLGGSGDRRRLESSHCPAPSRDEGLGMGVCPWRPAWESAGPFGAQ